MLSHCPYCSLAAEHRFSVKSEIVPIIYEDDDIIAAESVMSKEAEAAIRKRTVSKKAKSEIDRSVVSEALKKKLKEVLDAPEEEIVKALSVFSKMHRDRYNESEMLDIKAKIEPLGYELLTIQASLVAGHAHCEFKKL